MRRSYSPGSDCTNGSRNRIQVGYIVKAEDSQTGEVTRRGSFVTELKEIDRHENLRKQAVMSVEQYNEEDA